MVLSVVNTGSKGNCYVLQNSSTALVIEAGSTLKELKKAIGFDINKIDGVLVSHSHGDHAGFVKQYMDNGLKCYMSRATIDAQVIYGRGEHYCREYFDRVSFTTGQFDVIPFKVVHDVECHGFLISHTEVGRLVFMTDTRYSPFLIPNVDHWIVECNHSVAIINRRIQAGEVDAMQAKRVIENHMSLETLIEMFTVNDLTRCQTITLIHGSDVNSDSELFRRTITGKTAASVYVAERGMKININAAVTWI